MRSTANGFQALLVDREMVDDEIDGKGVNGTPREVWTEPIIN
jgi:hypothetical protein